jgi:pimeloyl-ACP methyl ester carboxylesterase
MSPLSFQRPLAWPRRSPAPNCNGALWGAGGSRDSHSRDVILMSQRGTHSAQPSLTCPEIDQFFARRLSLVYDAPSTGDEYVKAVKTCHDRLADGTDLSAFNSTESAYDLIDLRNALHVNQWNVFSHSYGTDLALTYARLDPQGMRSLVLDGVTPPSLVLFRRQ